MSRLPTLHHRSRRRPLAILIAAGIARGALAFATVLLFQRLSGDPDALRMVAAGLLGTALGLGLLRALETVQAERLGQAYVHSLRRRLVARLHDGGPDLRGFGRGSLWLRLTGDLNGLRRWISQGLARVLGALAMLSSLGLALAIFQPPLALLALLLVAACLAGMAWRGRRLREREQTLRRHRARLANQVERCLALATRPQSAQAGSDAEAARRRLAQRSRRVRDASVARAGVHAQVRALTEFAPLAALAAALLLAGPGGDGAALLPALALVGLLAAPLRDLALAWEMRQGYLVAAAKVRALLQDGAAAPSPDSPSRDSDSPPHPLPLHPITCRDP